MPAQIEIVYPIFLQCCQYTDNEFWSKIFENLAYAKTPYGSYISNDCIYCSHKKRNFIYKIDINNKPENLYNDIKTLLTNKLNVISDQDMTTKKILYAKMSENIQLSHSSWKGIKKNIKELLIEMYVITQMKTYDLSMKQARYLLSMVMLSLILKIIIPADIHYDGNEIANIDGITYTKNSVICTRNIFDISIPYVTEICKYKNTLSDKWGKYVQTL